MNDLRNAHPDEDQHELLATRGFGDAFYGLWVERDDIDQVAGALGLDSRTRCDSTLTGAMGRFTDPDMPLDEKNTVWIGSHSPGWSVAVSPLGLQSDLSLCEGKRRMLEVSWLSEIDGPYPLYYFFDGRSISEEIGEYWNGRLPSGSVFEPYVSGLIRDYDTDDEALAHAYLTIVGRMTGRFIDEAWFRTPGWIYGVQPAGRG
ncbi:hypothetical protein [Nonomuraea basaltis]|uniref:hypothetical protein n=1 Tax=Nonomuraea basaltis TaxID=2495887 RepID=UPI00110C5BF0|nr:hypothetical protein [Nonomuraea basaltis]TMR88703.1 hypothetical protein EJK15_64760 [Nonomuraea basaltis]